MIRSVFTSAILAALLSVQVDNASALDLTIEVSGAKSTKGHVMAELFSEAESWLKKPLQAERVVANERVTLVFRNIPAGRHALSVYHDENANGKLDTNLMRMPTETFGFSRDAKGMMGPPKFDDAALRMDVDTAIKVTLQ